MATSQRTAAPTSTQRTFTPEQRARRKATGKAWYEKNMASHAACMQAYYLKNRKKLAAQSKAWRQKNGDRLRAQQKVKNAARSADEKKKAKEYARGWRKKNKDKLKKYYRSWLRKNPEKVKAYRSKWFANSAADRERRRFAHCLYRSRAASKDGGFAACAATVKEIESAFNGRCQNPACGKSEAESGRRLCLDHCHLTGRFRGWLCKDCNTAAGLLRDCPKRAAGLADFLRDKVTG